MSKDDFKNPEDDDVKKEVIKKNSIFRLIEIPTQMGLAIETPNGEILTQEQLLIQIANDLQDIKQAVA